MEQDEATGILADGIARISCSEESHIDNLIERSKQKRFFRREYYLCE